MSEKLNTDLFRLLRLSLGQEEKQVSVGLSEEEFDALLKLAKRHEVQPMVAYGLLLKGDLTQQQEQRCRQLIYQVMLHQQRMELELQRICDLLGTAKIAHMPLKGAVIRKLYPESWMRTSGDIDILVKDVGEAANLLVGSGYIREETDAHEITFQSPKGVTIELHYLLIETDQKVNAVLEDVWDYASAEEHGYRYEMEPEMLYYYHIAHMAKHMVLGGCGIRFFADTWLLKKNLPMDEGKVEQLLQRGGLTVFAREAEKLSRIWFHGEPMLPLQESLESFVLDSGTFGSKRNEIQLHRAETGKPAEFIFWRVFKPYDRMVMQYPILKKYPILLPVFWVIRWLSLIFRREKRESALWELALNKNTDKNTVDMTRQLFEKLEL